jgi:hypothetical protein
MMRTVDELDASFPGINRSRAQASLGLLATLETKKLLVLIVAVAVSLFARVYRLDAAGFAEDEANKIFALRAYEQGDLTANAEHPMVMKVLCYASLRASAAWNESAGRKLNLFISDETALRLPNALFGALTVIPLFLFTCSLLGTRIGALTAAFWVAGVNAIAINRIAKEDTLLVFFMLAGFWLYNLAKKRTESDMEGQEKLFILAGVAFGLMIASKYLPHYFGLYALFYYLVSYDHRNNRPIPGRANMKFFGAMLLSFIAANPAVILPQTWRYLWKYVNEELVTHHGYLIGDKLFVNELSETPAGSPWYFYVLFLAVKVPLPVLIAFVVGVVEIFRHRGKYPECRGYLFLRLMLIFWMLPMSLVGAKFLRYTLTLLPIFYMIAAVGVVTIWRIVWWVMRKARLENGWARGLVSAAAATVFVIAPAFTAARAVLISHPSLYVNALGGGRVGYFFPHDEFYDLGARESIRYVAETAPPGSSLASEIPGVVEYYLERYNRSDIHIEIMSKPGFGLHASAPQFVLLQRGRLYFENKQNFEHIELNYPLAQASTFDGVSAAQVYLVSGERAKVGWAEDAPSR